ncbi:snake venom 5'-nucleotidase-like [Tachypleus tridentatus]|uniref:snake venom 5'-nucleotidase-like n=1 Tax=Tachypleus tridentatus TaxID=6853 RepID=UPI003FD360C7
MKEKYVGVFLCFVSFLIESSRANFNLTILHTNDVHARFGQLNKYGGRCPSDEATQGKCFGGVARQMTKIREIRQKNPNVLFLNAGDYYQGTLYYTIHKWRIVADFMNRLGHDAMALGNHEFDDGIEGLVPFLENVSFPVLSCNINSTLVTSVHGKIKRSKTVKISDQIIGLVGFITKDTANIGKVGDLLFTDEVECLQKEVNSLQNQGINKIIALGHAGFGKDKEIAQKVAGVDVVVGGHTNTFLYSGNPPSSEEAEDTYPVVVENLSGNKALVVQDYAFGKYLGYLEVGFDNKGRVMSWNGNPILLDNEVEEDPSILKALAPYTKEVIEKGRKTVGHTKVLLRGDRKVCRMKECNLGNFLADAAVHQYINAPTGDKWSRVAIGVWNSGAIRASIDEIINQGKVTMEDVLSVSPYRNTIDIVDLYGRDLITLLEHSVSDYDVKAEDPPGRFLQISGIRVTYDVHRSPGTRVVDLKVKCTSCRIPRYLPVNESEIYSVVMPTYLTKGGDGYAFIPRKAVKLYNTGDLDSDLLVKYIQKTTPVTQGLEDRITFRSKGKDCNATSRLINSFFLSTLLLLFLKEM